MGGWTGIGLGGGTTTVKKKHCHYCSSTAMRRINRTNFLQRTVLPWFGIYPWECAMCRKKTFFRDSGHSAMRRRTPKSDTSEATED